MGVASSRGDGRLAIQIFPPHASCSRWSQVPLTQALPSWWKTDSAVVDAANSYDYKQGLLSDRAWDALHKLNRNCTSLHAQRR